MTWSNQTDCPEVATRALNVGPGAGTVQTIPLTDTEVSALAGKWVKVKATGTGDQRTASAQNDTWIDAASPGASHGSETPLKVKGPTEEPPIGANGPDQQEGAGILCMLAVTPAMRTISTVTGTHDGEARLVEPSARESAIGKLAAVRWLSRSAYSA